MPLVAEEQPHSRLIFICAINCKITREALCIAQEKARQAQSRSRYVGAAAGVLVDIELPATVLCRPFQARWFYIHAPLECVRAADLRPVIDEFNVLLNLGKRRCSSVSEAKCADRAGNRKARQPSRENIAVVDALQSDVVGGC